MTETIIQFSIVIPLYNKEDTIERALQSVFNQTVQDFEVIIVNDGSSDNGSAVVKAISDPRVRLIHQENQGVSAARNRGVAEAQHELIAFLDADDEWLPEFLETIRRMINRYPNCGLYATRYFMRSTSGMQQPAIVRGLPDDFEGILENYFEIATHSNPPVWSSATCTRKSALEKIGGFPVGVTSGEDLLTWARIAINNKVSYAMCSMAINYLRYSEANKDLPLRVPDNNDIVGCGLEVILKECTGQDVNYIRHYCAHWHKMRASSYLRFGMYKKARIEIYSAIQKQPTLKVIVYWFLSFCPINLTRYIFRSAMNNG